LQRLWISQDLVKKAAIAAPNPSRYRATPYCYRNILPLRSTMSATHVI